MDRHHLAAIDKSEGSCYETLLDLDQLVYHLSFGKVQEHHYGRRDQVYPGDRC